MSWKAREVRPLRVTGLLVPLVAAGIAVGCGRPPYRALEVGQCLPAGAKVVGEREPDPPRVPCSAAHRYEVYAVDELRRSGEWPGAEWVDDAAREQCYDAFEDGVGIDPLDLPDGVLVLTIGPTEDSWEKGDRSVECLVQLPEERDERFIRRDEGSTV